MTDRKRHLPAGAAPGIITLCQDVLELSEYAQLFIAREVLHKCLTGRPYAIKRNNMRRTSGRKRAKSVQEERP